MGGSVTKGLIFRMLIQKHTEAHNYRGKKSSVLWSFIYIQCEIVLELGH